MENAGVNKELNAGAAASEGVMDGTPEITEENLFELVDSGKITLDAANEFIKTQEEALSDDSSVVTDEKDANFVPEINSEPDMGGVVSDDVKPYRVYNTQEEFQRDFDRSWNQRYGKQKAEQEKKDKEYSDLLLDLAKLLGTTPDMAASELRKRRMTTEAEREGKNPDEYIEIENLRAENARLKESEESAKAKAIVDEINAQGAKIAKTDPAFDINEAMKNPEFARQVFFTRQTNPERAVEIAYKIFYDGKKIVDAPLKPVVSQPPARPSEGAAVSKTSGEKKPVDFSKMSSKDILAMEKEIMRGKKFDI